jgi:hypothetical protein
VLGRSLESGVGVCSQLPTPTPNPP